MQPAIVSGNTTQEEMNKDTETEQMEQDQENSVVANSAPTLTPQQVADMSDGEVLSNFYLNPTSDLPEDAYQALQTRANDFANKVRVGNVTPDEMKKTSNAIAANNAKIQKGIGESVDCEDPLFTEAYTSGRKDSFDELYHGGGESDWGIDDEDSTHSDSYIPTQTSEEFMTTKRGQRAKMLFDLKDEVADRIEELTDGKIKYATVYDFVEKYIDKAHEKYNNKELEKYSKVSRGKVDFFAKVILMKYKRNKNFTKLFSNE